MIMGSSDERQSATLLGKYNSTTTLFDDRKLLSPLHSHLDALNVYHFGISQMHSLVQMEAKKILVLVSIRGIKNNQRIIRQVVWELSGGVAVPSGLPGDRMARVHV